MGWIFKALFFVAYGVTLQSAGVPSSESQPAEPRPAPAKEFACGSAAKPCPLQAWMRTTFAAAATRADADALARGFDFLAANAPPGYADWSRIAKEGAGLAHKKDVEGAKNTCQSCHGKYKSRYKEDMRDRPL